MKEIIPIASDHAGYELKLKIKAMLEEQGFEVIDYGTNSNDSCDYPDYAHQVGKVINNGTYKRGIVICGSGEGVSMTVNKYPNVRCGLCWLTEIAHLIRQHNNANVVALPARFIDESLAKEIVNEFLNTEFEGGRHEKRVSKINQLLA